MTACHLCGSEIVGRNAVQVLEDYRDMVTKAKAASELVGTADDVAQSLWSAAARRLRPESDAEDLADELRELRQEIKQASRELGAAGKAFRETLREDQGRATG